MGGRKSSRRGAAVISTLISLLLPGAALACDLYGAKASSAPAWEPAGDPRAAPSACPTSTDGGPAGAINPDQVITGEFDTSVQGSYVMLPFTVPAGTDAVRVKYCYDQPEAPTNAQIRNTIDLGIYDVQGADGLWDSEEFRGWGGSSHPDVTVSPNGFSTEAQYIEAPKRHRHGRTTRGFIPGPMDPGEWAVELGVAAVTSQQEGDSDGKVAWRVEIEEIDDPTYSDTPYVPAPYDSTAADSDPGWYAGDFHVHSEHSALGDAPMTEVFDYAFNPLAPGNLPTGGAGLDFVTLSDYVTTSAWGEIGRYQAAHSDKLIMRSAEVITYRGHTNNHASLDWADYRTGAIYERQGDGSLTPLRAPQAPSTIFDTVNNGGGFTQINHPTIFPSQVPGFDSFCRGCPWDYSDAETDYSKVDAIEVATGPAGLKTAPYPGPNPFTPLAVQFYDHALGTGAKIAAVGSSDSHQAGEAAGNVSDVTGAPIGMATTMVQADELSESGIQQGVEAGHTYVKIWGGDGPDLRFCAGPLGVDGECSEDPDSTEQIMGDTVSAASTDFTVRVMGAGPGLEPRPGAYSLIVYKDGVPTVQVPITSNDFTFNFPSFGLGDYRLQVMRSNLGVASVEDVSSPIYLEAAGPPPDTDADDDGIDDDADNCPLTANPGQENLDGDRLGDACDADRDGDGSDDVVDDCPVQAGPGSNAGCPVPANGDSSGPETDAGVALADVTAGKRAKRCRKKGPAGSAARKRCKKRG